MYVFHRFFSHAWPLLVLLLTLAGCGRSSTDKQSDAATTTDSARNPATGPSPTARKTIVFYGNSLTAGYGLEPSQAFPALIQEKIDSAGLNYTVVNAGLSGETTAGGRSRISWVLRQPADVFVLELGGNDGLRGLDLNATRQNLQAIIDTVRKKNPETTIVIAGMQIPPNFGQAYTTQFRVIFKELADRNKAILIPFLLEGVGGVPRLNQPDGIHPTAEGHQLIAETVWRVLEPLLADQATQS